MRGGYLIIDLNNVNFTIGVGMVVDGIYERIESTRKPIRLCNVKIDNLEVRDIDIVNIGVKESDYFAKITIGEGVTNMTITDTNVVTFLEAE